MLYGEFSDVLRALKKHKKKPKTLRSWAKSTKGGGWRRQPWQDKWQKLKQLAGKYSLLPAMETLNGLPAIIFLNWPVSLLPLSLLTANFRKTISSSVKQIVPFFFVQRKKTFNQAFEFGPGFTSMCFKMPSALTMSIGINACLRVFSGMARVVFP